LLSARLEAGGRSNRFLVCDYSIALFQANPPTFQASHRHRRRCAQGSKNRLGLIQCGLGSREITQLRFSGCQMQQAAGYLVSCAQASKFSNDLPS
jgi:hypothetical protein